MTTTGTWTRVARAAVAVALCGAAALTASPGAQAVPDTAVSTAQVAQPGSGMRAAAQGVAARSRDATLATALSGYIPCSIGASYHLGCGRMRNGRLTLNRDAPPHARIEIKDIDGPGRRTSVRLVDVAGDSRKEAVVIISANAGGVGWPNVVTVYDGLGRLLTTWDSGTAVSAGRKNAGGAREATSFTRTRKNSVDLRVEGIASGNQCAACGTGVDVYRLSKSRNGKPAIRLITRR
ncbi:hypothetical protein [Mobilicoccus sp.]|uniref:hypothetical protein n=1 Tax=Mobilicoccus sp. TaxID=2034349 RepID=UPI0028AE6C3A|nr:hypothetical protein [Mobilicoccus sp.]